MPGPKIREFTVDPFLPAASEMNALCCLSPPRPSVRFHPANPIRLAASQALHNEDAARCPRPTQLHAFVKTDWRHNARCLAGRMEGTGRDAISPSRAHTFSKADYLMTQNMLEMKGYKHRPQ
ncbi:hypothetical protein AMECASPLE_009159 [Ameca splendens]|uniref:Uncharacterized protein n=1 Tax=Ameca splendens TaxID=208324 RepID=A0ABV0YMM3_9TELE